MNISKKDKNFSDISNYKIDDFDKKSFWDKIFSNLNLCTVLPPNTRNEFKEFETDKNFIDTSRARLITEGYIEIPQLQWDDWFLDVKKGIELLNSLGIPVPFIFTMCQPWMLLSKLSKVVKGLFGEEYCLLPDFWAWHVDPNKQGAGWGPHRDKGPYSLFENGKPKSLTVWIPLSDATTENSCMYLLPANRDPSYLLDNWKKELIDLQSIVALPVKTGSPLIWNSNVLHWGSRSLPRNNSPRISVAFEVQIARLKPFKKPTFEPLQVPNFDFRLRLICLQILQYSHMYPLQKDLEYFARKKVNIND